MAYEQFEIPLLMSHAEDVKNGKLLKDNIDISGGKARNKYNQYIESIKRLNAREFKISAFPMIGTNEVLNIAGSIILYIYGPEVIPVYEDFLKVLHSTKTDQALNGISVVTLNQITNETKKLVEVPDMRYCSTAVTIVHEFTYFIFRKLNIDNSKKRYYDEILSIYAEKVANFLITIELGKEGPLFSQRIEETRLEVIAWHYTVGVTEAEKLVREYAKCKASKNPTISVLSYISSVEKELPIVKTPEGRSLLLSYYQNKADSYGMGYLYAEYLFQKSLEDQKQATTQLKRLLNKEQTLQELLDFYNINARNYQVYDAVNQRLELVRKGK